MLREFIRTFLNEAEVTDLGKERELRWIRRVVDHYEETGEVPEGEDLERFKYFEASHLAYEDLLSQDEWESIVALKREIDRVRRHKEHKASEAGKVTSIQAPKFKRMAQLAVDYVEFLEDTGNLAQGFTHADVIEMDITVEESDLPPNEKERVRKLLGIAEDELERRDRAAAKPRHLRPVE